MLIFSVDFKDLLGGRIFNFLLNSQKGVACTQLDLSGRGYDISHFACQALSQAVSVVFLCIKM
jgi:hypothetical protein